jgi:hypothetical protein
LRKKRKTTNKFDEVDGIARYHDSAEITSMRASVQCEPIEIPDHTDEERDAIVGPGGFVIGQKPDWNGPTEDVLSDLDEFQPIEKLLKRGGDTSNRVQFILNQFGGNADDGECKSIALKGRSRTSGISSTPGLNPINTTNRKNIRASRGKNFGGRRHF